MVLKVIMFLLIFSFLEEMGEARKKQKLCDMIYYGFLMVSTMIAVWR